MNKNIHIVFHSMQVTKANIHFMRKLVENGATQHPGANFIIQQNTKIKKYETVLLRVYTFCDKLCYFIITSLKPVFYF